MKTVRHLLHKKDNAIWSIPPDSTVYDAIKLMAEKQVGALMVLEDEQLIGIFTERDYLHKIALAGRASRETCVREVMSPRVLFVTPDQSVDECMALMSEKQIRHLPVVDDKRLLGVVSMRDVVAEAIADREFLINQLEHYVTEQRIWRGARVVAE